MRYAVVVKPGLSPCVLIWIDTNQGVYGLGSTRHFLALENHSLDVPF
jgi:hypothetical protein